MYLSSWTFSICMSFSIFGFFPLVFSSFVFAPAALNYYLINIHFQSRRKFTKNIRVEGILSAKVDNKIVL